MYNVAIFHEADNNSFRHANISIAQGSTPSSQSLVFVYTPFPQQANTPLTITPERCGELRMKSL